MSRYRAIVYTLLSLALFGIATGFVAGIAARAFTSAMHGVNVWLGVAPATLPPQGPSAPALLAVLLGGGLIVGLLQLGRASAGALGPADTIEATHRARGRIAVPAALRGTLASFVALGSGASAGQYGPLVHFGATLGSLLARTRWLDTSMASIGIGCGVAAAIAAAFAAPIAGVVFAHEVLLRHYSLRAFAPITVAAVTGHWFGTSLFDAETLAVLRSVEALPVASFPALTVLGVLSALLAKAFMHAVEIASHAARHSRLPVWLQPVCGALVLAGIALLLPEVLGAGLWPLRQTLLGEFAAGSIAILLAGKLVATAVCLGFGFAGGILGPSLLLGALFGALFSAALTLLLPELAPTQVFAVGAMAAMTSAVIGAPLTTILIVFELTHNYELTVAVMVTVVFSNLVSYRLYGRSFYDQQLRERGIDFSLGHERVRLQFTPITPYIDHSLPTLLCGTPVAAARTALLEAQAAEAHLLDADGRFRGVLHLADLPRTDAQAANAPIDDYIVAEPTTLPESTSVWGAMQALESYAGDCVPVLGDGGAYRGVLHEASVIRAYLDTLNMLRREEHTAG